MKRLEEGIGFNISRLARVLKSNWSETIADLGITPPHAAILRTIYEANGVIGLREVARRLRADPMNVKRGIDFLEDAGMISSSVSERGRPRFISLTASGVETAVELIDRITSQEKIFEECLTKEEINELSSTLGKVQGYLDSLTAKRENFES